MGKQPAQTMFDKLNAFSKFATLGRSSKLQAETNRRRRASLGGVYASDDANYDRDATNAAELHALNNYATNGGGGGGGTLGRKSFHIDLNSDVVLQLNRGLMRRSQSTESLNISLHQKWRTIDINIDSPKRDVNTENGNECWLDENPYQDLNLALPTCESPDNGENTVKFEVGQDSDTYSETVIGAAQEELDSEVFVDENPYEDTEFIRQSLETTTNTRDDNVNVNRKDTEIVRQKSTTESEEERSLDFLENETDSDEDFHDTVVKELNVIEISEQGVVSRLKTELEETKRPNGFVQRPLLSSNARSGQRAHETQKEQTPGRKSPGFLKKVECLTHRLDSTPHKETNKLAKLPAKDFPLKPGASRLCGALHVFKQLDQQELACRQNRFGDQPGTTVKPRQDTVNRNHLELISGENAKTKEKNATGSVTLERDPGSPRTPVGKKFSATNSAFEGKTSSISKTMDSYLESRGILAVDSTDDELEEEEEEELDDSDEEIDGIRSSRNLEEIENLNDGQHWKSDGAGTEESCHDDDTFELSDVLNKFEIIEEDIMECTEPSRQKRPKPKLLPKPKPPLKPKPVLHTNKAAAQSANKSSESEGRMIKKVHALVSSFESAPLPEPRLPLHSIGDSTQQSKTKASRDQEYSVSATEEDRKKTKRKEINAKLEAMLTMPESGHDNCPNVGGKTGRWHTTEAVTRVSPSSCALDPTQTRQEDGAIVPKSPLASPARSRADSRFDSECESLHYGTMESSSGCSEQSSGSGSIGSSASLSLPSPQSPSTSPKHSASGHKTWLASTPPSWDQSSITSNDATSVSVSLSEDGLDGETASGQGDNSALNSDGNDDVALEEDSGSKPGRQVSQRWQKNHLKKVSAHLQTGSGAAVKRRLQKIQSADNLKRFSHYLANKRPSLDLLSEPINR